MMKYLSRRIMVLSALYICIIIGIFAVQFTDGKAFSLTLGLLRIAGTGDLAEAGDTRPVLPFHVGANGVDFFLDDGHPPIAYTADNKPEELKVTGFRAGDSRFTVLCSGGVSLSFASEVRGDTDIVSVSADVPSNYQKVTLPYKITRSARVEKKDELTLVVSGEKRYVFTGIQLDPAAGAAVRRLSIARSSPVVYYRTWIPSKGLAIEELASIPQSSDAAYSKAVEQYAGYALASFHESVAAGSLNEPLVAAYIAEMGRIGMYRTALESIPDSYRNGSSRTWQTNTFLNNLEKTTVGLMLKEKDDRTDLSRKISSGDPSCFEFPSLVPYLLDRGSSMLLADLAGMASTLDMTTVTGRQAAGILEAMMDFTKYAPNSSNTLQSLADSCERKLRSSLLRIGDSLYYSEDGALVDTMAALRIAPVLIRYGTEVPGHAGWKAAGHLLVTSMVAFTGERALLPAKFAVAGNDTEKTGIIAKAEQMLSASQVYPVLVTGNTWYPHAQSLALEAGPGVWAWTSARSVHASVPAAGSLKITTRFPQGETHYMVLRGIKPFKRIQIYGMDFHTDARFETYNSSGYRYNEETGTLYLKMRHKAEYEDIVIWFGATEPSPAASPAPAAPAVPSPESPAG